MKIIADCCANHCGEREKMAEMIRQAAEAGVDYVKFQSWKADKLRKDWPDYKIAYEYYKKHELSEGDHKFLVRECEKNNIGFLTTVFDLDTVDFLCKITDRVKIASPDANNWALINKCLAKFEHVVISTGMHSQEEIGALIGYTKENWHRMTFLHCVSLYPTPLDKLNLIRIASLQEFLPSVGLSDHTLGTDAGKVAACYGLACLEKHFTLDRTLPGKDQAMSATVDEFKELVEWRDKVNMMMYNPGFHDEGARAYINKWSG